MSRAWRCRRGAGGWRRGRKRRAPSDPSVCCRLTPRRCQSRTRVRDDEHFGIVEAEESDAEAVVLLSGGEAPRAEHFNPLVQIIEQHDAIEDRLLEGMPYEDECLLQAGARVGLQVRQTTALLTSENEVVLVDACGLDSPLLLCRESRFRRIAVSSEAVLLLRAPASTAGK
jgi:hypothetical protein